MADDRLYQFARAVAEIVTELVYSASKDLILEVNSEIISYGWL